jgi:peptidoglycan/LPS O-acetylase OafA/YrhL
VIGNGRLGVSIFFVISGFLITSLLLKERSETGQLSLSRFYIRRAFRILPPYYAFLIILLLLERTDFLDVGLRGRTDPQTFWLRWQASFVFLRDYLGNGSWWTDHTWSLSVEEQFYLLWPACLAWAGLVKSKKVAGALMLASPAIRVVCHFLFPSLGMQRELMMFHMCLDSLMTGCAMAIFYQHLQFKWRWTLPAAIFLFVVSPYLADHLHGYYELPFGVSLDNLAIGYLLLYAVRNPDSLFGHVLNHRIVAHIGVLSYSLYLWQQLFLGEFPLPWGLLGAFLAAELSWRVIEKPSLKLRDTALAPSRLAAT